MDELIQLIQENVTYAPYVIFGVLLLAGLNLPISEDALLFASALLAVKNPDKLEILFASVFLGAYISDLIAYSLGRYLGPKIWEIKFIAKFLDQKMIDKLNSFYDRHGSLTLFIGRFIPFGVRNALFISAGLAKMNFKKFAAVDFAACLISCSTYFSLYYHFGPDVLDFIKKSNIVIFSFFILFLTFILIRKKFNKKSANNSL